MPSVLIQKLQHMQDCMILSLERMSKQNKSGLLICFCGNAFVDLQTHIKRSEIMTKNVIRKQTLHL